MPITIIPGAEGFTSLELFQRAAEFAGLTLPSSDTVAVVPIGEVEGVRYYISFAVSDDGAGIILQPCFAGAGGGKGVVYVWPNIKKHFGETTTVVQQALKKRTLIMRWNALGLDQPRTLDNLFENRFAASYSARIALAKTRANPFNPAPYGKFGKMFVEQDSQRILMREWNDQLLLYCNEDLGVETLIGIARTT